MTGMTNGTVSIESGGKTGLCVKEHSENGLENVDWDKAARIFAPEKESWEKRIKKGIEKYPLTKDLLIILAAGGLISLALIAPPLAGMIAKEVKWQERARLNQRLERLRKRKLVNVSYRNGETVLEITQDGRKRALEYKFDEMKIKKPREWDNKWRIVIFDIAEERKAMRERLRAKLKELGFLSLNDSVLIYPYPCPDEIEFIRQVFGVGKEVTYLATERFEGDDYYYNWFFL